MLLKWDQKENSSLWMGGQGGLKGEEEQVHRGLLLKQIFPLLWIYLWHILPSQREEE